MMREHRSLAPPQLMHELYRRKLPHWRTEGATYFVTWRLALEQSRLAPPERDLVAAAVRAFDGQRYRLAAWVAMDDHVHVLLTPLGTWRLRAFSTPGSRLLQIRCSARIHEPDAYGRTSPSTELCAMRASWSKNSITSSATRGGVGPPSTAMCGSGPATKVGSWGRIQEGVQVLSYPSP